MLRIASKMAASEAEEDVVEDKKEIRMLDEHKALLVESLPALTGGMNTEVVLRQLKKREVIEQYDVEQVKANSNSTTVGRNEFLLELLQRRGPHAFDEFFNILMLYDPAMSYHLLPVRYRILWFAPSPALAAMVEYTLHKYYNVSFSNIEGRKSQKKYLQKRVRVFQKTVDYGSVNAIEEGRREEYVKYSQDCEVTLTFPIAGKADLVDLAIEEALNDHSDFDLFVMSGVCEGVRSDGDNVKGGEVVVTTEAHTHPGIDRKISPKDEFIAVTKKELTDHFRTQPSPWADEAKFKLAPPIGEHPSPIPHFGSVCSSPLSVVESTPPLSASIQFLAADTHTFKFYEQCQKNSGDLKPWLSCLGVRSYTSLNNQDCSQDNSGCSMASTGVVFELCRIWYKKTNA